jgi:hypothetical protein
MEQKKREYVWLKKSDYLKESLLLKILYYLGVYRFLDCTKIISSTSLVAPDNIQFHSGGFYRVYMGLRWWNPLTWLFIIILTILVFFVEGISGLKKMFKDNCKELRIEESVSKFLYDTEGKRVY